MRTLFSSLGLQVSHFMQNWQALSFRQQRKLDAFFAELNKKKAPSWQDALAYANFLVIGLLTRLELHTATVVVMLLTFGTGIFLPFEVVSLPYRTSLILVAMLLGTGLGFLLVYLLSTLHIRFDINLWVVGGLHAFASSLLFCWIEPWITRHFQGYVSQSFILLFPPVFLLYAVTDIFLLWRIKKLICFRHFKATQPPTDLANLIPPEKRGAVYLISAADHYVEFFTEKGSHLRRMTLKEAIEKADTQSGVQVHRSHWVAFSAIVSLEKDGARVFLMLRDGQRIPVSKSTLPALQSHLQAA